MSEIEVPTLPGMEGTVNALDEAQLRAAAARRVFEAKGSDYPWLDLYFRLQGEGWHWKQAVYIAWLAMPAQYRQPKTQIALATEVLGLASDRRLREWKEQNPGIEERSIQLQRNRFFEAIPGVMEALIESAQSPGGRNSATDRRTFFDLVGVEDKLGQREALPEDLGSVGTDALRRQVRALESGEEAPLPDPPPARTQGEEEAYGG